MIIILESPSQVLVLPVLASSFILEEHSSNNLKLSLPGGSVSGAYLDLALERTVLPVIEFVLIVSRHLQSLLSVLVYQLEIIATVKWLTACLRFAVKDPVVV